jgi:hypothetical protein
MATSEAWARVDRAVPEAVGIAWDGCHKIYVLMDETQMSLMEGYGYDPLLRVEDIGELQTKTLLREWYRASCELRFISSVGTVEGDPNAGFGDLIAQFDDERVS